MKKILLIEDDPQYRQLVKERLLKEGYTVKEAGNGREGLDFLMKEDVDLIILDLIMPQIDGVTFLHHLHNSLMKKIPVILLTNLDHAAYQPEIQEFLLKANVSLDDVVHTVNKYTQQ